MLMELAGLDLERRLNRETRPQAARLIRGIAAALVLGVFACLAGYAVSRLGWVAELIFLSLCVNVTIPLKLVRRITRHLRRDEWPAAVEALQPYLKAPLDKADTHALIRRAIEFIVLSLHRFLAAPVFWFLAAGPVGLSLYTTYSALYQAFGLPDKRRRYFGWCVRVIDMLLNIVPAFLTVLLLCASALFVSKSNPLRALLTLFRQGRPYSGWLMAAMAGGLGVTLGGSLWHSADYTEEQAWIGSKGSSARLGVEDLERAALLQYVFFMCFVVALSALMIMRI